MLVKKRRSAGGAVLPPWIVSVPTITDLTPFSATTNFPDVSGAGGFRAQFDGLTATGTILLPANIDTSRPFHFGALFEYRSGDARDTIVNLQSTVEQSFLGIVFQVGANGVKISTGTHTFFSLAANLVNLDRFWLGISFDATGNVEVWMTPDMHGPFFNASTFGGSVHADYAVPIAKTYAGGSNGNGGWLTGVSKIVLATGSQQTRVLSVFARQGDFLSGPADRKEPPTLLNPVINGDTTPLIRVPEYQVASGARDLVVIFHGANSSETFGQTDGQGGDQGVAFASLVEAGYAIAIMRGTDDFSGTTFSGPKASNWGAPNALLTWWKQLIDDTKAKFGFRNVYFVGQSMGLVNALNLHALSPTTAKAIIGISGACNLGYAYGTEGFAASINAAYGAGTDAAVVAANDPTVRAALYNLPIKLWHGTIDATLSKANHMDTFAAAVNAAHPGKVATVAVAGADHLVAAMYDGPAILAFLQANP
jgi:hypothetical protein